MLGALVLACVLAAASAPGSEHEARARWLCEPATVAVGEPFALVLELEHAPDLAARALVPEKLVLDESWVVLGEEPLASTASTEGHGPGGSMLTRCTWRVASLEPGERALADALSGLALGERVTHIQVGDARLVVRALLAEGEDQPRALRGFGAGFAGEDEEGGAEDAGKAGWVALSLGLLAAGLACAFVLARRRRARLGAGRTPAAPLERLAELERALAGSPDGARGAESCYVLTRLLREAGDRLRKEPATGRPGTGLTDEEWLAAVHASLEVPRGVMAELTAVFERAARVKYAGEAPTSWALQETFSRARAALEALAGGARA